MEHTEDDNILDISSGKRLQFAIDHGPVEIVDLPINSMGGFSIAM